MNGQLREKPLVELIREISSKSLTGRLQLEHERVKVVAYFESGNFLYAATNLRTLRLREYLLKSNLVSQNALAQFNDRVSDIDMVKVLCVQKFLTPPAAEQTQSNQVSDVLRLALMWTDGTWDFDPRSRLKDTLNLSIDLDSLLMEAERRLPAKAPAEPMNSAETEVDPNDARAFIQRVQSAQTFYQVLDVNWDAPAQELKTIYYQLARRYHPDRFRKEHPSLVPHLESAFAKIKQAYDTLRDDNLRANYNAKLEARRKVEQQAESGQQATTQPAGHEPVVEGAGEPVVSKAERAAIQFKEGLAALELGEKKTALGLFASAATAVPNEARYRAHYGHLLAGSERTRRTAEAELQAAIKLDPNNANYRVMLAELYQDLGLKLRAKGEAERAVAADPNNPKARELLRALKQV